MNGFGYEDDSDHCGCEFAEQCDYHKKKSEEYDRQAREELKSKGINPDFQVDDDNLLSLVLLLRQCNTLSQYQKDAIERIMFPL